MDWISQFTLAFVLPTAFILLFTVFMAFCDNLSYPWKHWTAKQTIAGFLFGPSVGMLVCGFWMAMLMHFSHQPFVFERWLTVAVFIFVGIFTARLSNTYFDTGKSCIERQEEYEHNHGVNS
jgi:hypothetical protein